MSIRHTTQYDATTVTPTPATLPAKSLAVLRIATGLVFLWAFLDNLFGLGGIGIAVTLGVALRFSAIAGSVMMLLMWLAEFPPDRFTTAGEPSMSTNPLIDYHVIYAIALVVAAVTYAGNTWGLGRWWAALPFIRRHPWAI